MNTFIWDRRVTILYITLLLTTAEQNKLTFKVCLQTLQFHADIVIRNCPYRSGQCDGGFSYHDYSEVVGWVPNFHRRDFRARTVVDNKSSRDS